MKSLSIPALALSIALASSTPMFANGARLPSQDAVAVARGYAWTATADSPSAVYYNPAGLAFLEGAEVQAGVHFLRSEGSYSGAAGSASMKSETFALPSIFASQPVIKGDRSVTVGLGVYAPFGTRTEWPANGPFATVATRNEIEFVRYSFTVAARFSEHVSVGASLQYNDVDADLHRAVGLSPGDDFGFLGSGTSWSYNVGVMYRPLPRHSFGFQYQSKVSMGIDGMTSLTPYNVSEPGAVDWVFPQHFAIGYSYRPSEQWNIEVGYDRTYWSALKTLTLQRPVSGPLPIPFNWHDSAYYGLGATYYAGGFRYSAGVNYSENSVPNQWFSPSVPDVTRTLFNVGVGYTGGAWKVDTLVQWAPNTERSVVGSAQSTPFQTVDGTYRAKLMGFTIQGAYRW